MQDLTALASDASKGDRLALDKFLRAIKDDVYGLAMRMLGHPADAEDATQEILLKIVTHLSSFRGESGIRTWVWRIATNHITSIKRGRREPAGLTFEAFGQMLDAGVAAGIAAPVTPDAALLEAEVKLGCTQAMLMCLDREHRLAFLLGEVLEMTGDDGAAVLGIEPATFRKRVSRARQRLREFMEAKCGLVSESAACRCAKQVGPSIHTGMLKADQMVYAIHRTRPTDDPSVWKMFQAVEAVHRSTAVFREHPDYATPEGALEQFRQLVAEIQ